MAGTTQSNQQKLGNTGENKDLYFPDEMKSPDEWIPYIKFSRHKVIAPISRENIGNASADQGETTDMAPISSIKIMLPPTLSDQNSAIYDKEEMPFAAALESQTAMGNIRSQLEKLTTIDSNPGENFMAGLDLMANIGQGAITGLMRKMLLSSNITRRLTGTTLNPQVTYLFKTVNNRSFTFSFVMNAKTRNESDQIRRIVREFKTIMYPKSSTFNELLFGDNNNNLNSGRDFYLKTPDILRICYYYGNSEHNWLHKFKDCVITSVNAEYGGQTGTWTQFPPANKDNEEDVEDMNVIFTGGAPTQVTLTITVEEINIVTQDDVLEGY